MVYDDKLDVLERTRRWQLGNLGALERTGRQQLGYSRELVSRCFLFHRQLVW